MKEIMTNGSMDCEMCGGSFGCAGSYAAGRDFQERKSISRPSHLISQARFRLSLCYLTSSSSMSTFQNTEYMDARGATFNNVGRDQVNQVIMNPMNPGAMQNHSCTIICSFPVIPDSRSQGTAKPSTRRCV